MKIAFTICSANYLPFAKSLADSLVQYNPDYKFVIALADTYNQYEEDFFAPHLVVPVRSMQLPGFEEMNAQYTIFQLSCALKPYIAQYLLDTYTDCNTVFYFDSDIFFYGSLQLAETILQTHCLVLTPHVAKAQPYEVGISTELDVLRSGVYNAGFFGINRSKESFAFLAWWKQRLEHLCINDARRGLFDDQVWLNFAPLYFKSTFILFDPGYNLAYWNFPERELSLVNKRYLVNEKYPLVFFHYSGYNIHQPQVLTKHRATYTFETMPVYKHLFENYVETVMRNNKNNFFALPTTLGIPPQKKKRFKIF